MWSNGFPGGGGGKDPEGQGFYRQINGEYTAIGAATTITVECPFAPTSVYGRAVSQAVMFGWSSGIGAYRAGSATYIPSGFGAMEVTINGNTISFTPFDYLAVGNTIRYTITGRAQD